MKIFTDAQLKNEVDANNLSLGELRASESQIYTFFVTTDVRLRGLKFSLNNSELKIVSAPEELKIDEVAKLEIEWKCNPEIEQKLVAQLSISADKILE
jgi:hypothetical protein